MYRLQFKWLKYNRIGVLLFNEKLESFVIKITVL